MLLNVLWLNWKYRKYFCCNMQFCNLCYYLAHLIPLKLFNVLILVIEVIEKNFAYRVELFYIKYELMTKSNLSRSVLSLGNHPLKTVVPRSPESWHLPRRFMSCKCSNLMKQIFHLSITMRVSKCLQKEHVFRKKFKFLRYNICMNVNSFRVTQESRLCIRTKWILYNLLKL